MRPILYRYDVYAPNNKFGCYFCEPVVRRCFFEGNLNSWGIYEEFTLSSENNHVNTSLSRPNLRFLKGGCSGTSEIAGHVHRSLFSARPDWCLNSTEFLRRKNRFLKNSSATERKRCLLEKSILNSLHIRPKNGSWKLFGYSDPDVEFFIWRVQTGILRSCPTPQK